MAQAQDKFLIASDAHSESEIVLGLLTVVEDDAQTTQRSMAGQLGIALGLANAYLKRCIKKGLIKVQTVPANRYAYYLTPHGFAEKSRLTAEYLSQGFKFFRIARQEMDVIFEQCARHQWRRVALYGLTDLTEIAVMSADVSCEIVAIVDARKNQAGFTNIRVVGSLGEIDCPDAVIITDLEDGQSSYDALAREFDDARILVPAFLHVRRARSKLVGPVS